MTNVLWRIQQSESKCEHPGEVDSARTSMEEEDYCWSAMFCTVNQWLFQGVGERNDKEGPRRFQLDAHERRSHVMKFAFTQTLY